MSNGVFRTYFRAGDARLTRSGQVQFRVVSVDTTNNTATVGVRRTDTPASAAVQLTSKFMDTDQRLVEDATGGQVAAVVTTAQPSWSATADQSWATVTPSGTSGQRLLVTVEPNRTSQERTVTVTVTAGAGVTRMTVTQAAGPSQDDCAHYSNWTCWWLDPGSPARGAIETSGDKDWFRLPISVTGTWSFTVAGTGATPLSGPVGNVLTTTGSVLDSGHATRGNNQYTFTAELSAGMPYVFQVTGENAATGAYTVTAAAPAADECGESVATACVWSNLGTPVNGHIEVGGDKDWYKITPAVSGSWTFASSGGLPDAYGTLWDANGNMLTYNDDVNYQTNWNFSVTWNLVAGTSYYLEARDRVRTNTGAYTLTATPPPVTPVISVSPTRWDPTAASTSQPVQLTSNSSWQVGVLPDWITASRLFGSGNDTVTLTVTPNISTQPRSYSVKFAVSGMEASVAVTQAGQVRPADDCGQTVDTACTWLNLGTPVNGSLEVGSDKDWYRITPTVSGSWTFTSSGGVSDPVAKLFDAAGNYLTYHDDISYPDNKNFALTWSLVAGTTYYLEVRNYSGTPGSYTVTATGPQGSGQPNGDDCGEAVYTACDWSNLGTPVNGRIDVYDKDWFRITPTVSGTWTFTSSGGLTDPVGTLFDASGRIIILNDDINWPGNLQFAVTRDLVAGQTYYLEVRTYGKATGTYTITATRT